MPDQPLLNELQKRAQRSELFQILSEDCPFDKNNPSTCVLEAMRKKSPARQKAWFDRLGAETVRRLHTACQLCWKKR